MNRQTIIIGIVVVIVLAALYYYSRKEGFTAPLITKSDVMSDTGRGLQNRESEKRYQDVVKNLHNFTDYDAVIKEMALEPAIFESHNQYSDDISQFNLGPSMLPERTDPNDINKWVGLRRPNYHDVFADSTARQTQSEIPDQMPFERHITI